MNLQDSLGTCPNCGSEALNYGAIELLGEEVSYPFTCDDCGSEGEEYFELSYIGTNLETINNFHEED